MMQYIERRRTGLILMCSGWSAILSFLAVVPHQFITDTMHMKMSFDLGHGIGYALLGLFLTAYFKASQERFSKTAYLKNPMVATLVVLLFWGCLNEVLQIGTVDRTPDYNDVLWDMVGGIIGMTTFWLLSRRPIRQKLSTLISFSK